MQVDTNDMLSITEANARGVSKLAAEAFAGRDLVLLRNNKVIAAVVGIDRLEELDRLTALREDLELIALTLSRVATDNGNRTDLDEVMARFGITREDLVDVED
jgi:hypothetical protein